jgi:hypothetical protein
MDSIRQAIARLLAAGHKVAVSEQPGEDGGERLLRRFTPATSVDADVVPGERTNNLTVALTEGQAVAFAWVDRGGRLRRDSVSVPLSGASAGWVDPVPLPKCHAEGEARPE